MMYSYPFFSFPYFRRYTPSSTMYYNRSSLATSKLNEYPPEFSRGYYNHNIHTTEKNYKSSNKPKDPNENKKANTKSSYGFSFLDNFFNQTDRGEDESFFDLFGLKLYNDDLLLIGLIFFLYKEDVKDQYLFIALVLLLLS